MQKCSSVGDRVSVLCGLDGHGREVGKVAAVAAKKCLFSYLDENYIALVRADRYYKYHFWLCLSIQRFYFAIKKLCSYIPYVEVTVIHQPWLVS